MLLKRDSESLFGGLVFVALALRAFFTFFLILALRVVFAQQRLVTVFHFFVLTLAVVILLRALVVPFADAQVSRRTITCSNTCGLRSDCGTSTENIEFDRLLLLIILALEVLLNSEKRIRIRTKKSHTLAEAT
jgi:hypothetical protein